MIIFLKKKKKAAGNEKKKVFSKSFLTLIFWAVLPTLEVRKWLFSGVWRCEPLQADGGASARWVPGALPFLPATAVQSYFVPTSRNNQKESHEDHFVNLILKQWVIRALFFFLALVPFLHTATLQGDHAQHCVRPLPRRLITTCAREHTESQQARWSLVKGTFRKLISQTCYDKHEVTTVVDFKICSHNTDRQLSICKPDSTACATLPSQDQPAARIPTRRSSRGHWGCWKTWNALRMAENYANKGEEGTGKESLKA